MNFFKLVKFLNQFNFLSLAFSTSCLKKGFFGGVVGKMGAWLFGGFWKRIRSIAITITHYSPLIPLSHFHFTYTHYTPIILHTNLSTITSKVLIRNKQVLIVLREGTFFLGGGGGLGNFGIFSKRKCWPSLMFWLKNSWPPTFRWLTKVWPSPHYHMVCSMP